MKTGSTVVCSSPPIIWRHHFVAAEQHWQCSAQWNSKSGLATVASSVIANGIGAEGIVIALAHRLDVLAPSIRRDQSMNCATGLVEAWRFLNESATAAATLLPRRENVTDPGSGLCNVANTTMRNQLDVVMGIHHFAVGLRSVKQEAESTTRRDAGQRLKANDMLTACQHYAADGDHVHLANGLASHWAGDRYVRM